ncbi:rhomboid family intramembrane serine protease [Arachidicoccus sp.]|uniref:rhomboid family intramembrane serine protease n=1 Tax=Arachidicoccus sp. TaxID=1872624 RepID=UPI003D1BF54A
MHQVSITLLIVIVTCVVSFVAFSNQKYIDDLIFYPPAISRRKQWYRFFSCGLIHADFAHLAFNMYAFYTFGEYVEDAFNNIFGPTSGRILYLLLYVSALMVCLLPTYFKNKDNYAYKSLGASGAVSAVVFASILLMPTSEIGLIFVPFLRLPSFIFGAIYLIITAWLDRRGSGRINHSAHLYGSLYGIVFLIVACKLLSHYPVVDEFVFFVRSYFQF